MKHGVIGTAASILVHAVAIVVLFHVAVHERVEPVTVIDFSLASSSAPIPLATPPLQPKPRPTPRSRIVDNHAEVPDSAVPEAPRPDSVAPPAEIASVNTGTKPEKPQPGNRDGAADTAAANKTYLSVNFTAIRDRIYRNTIYPMAAKDRGWEGTVKLMFYVNRDGSADSLRVLEGSGYPVLDANAVKTVLRSAPFPPAPGRLKIILPIIYRLE